MNIFNNIFKFYIVINIITFIGELLLPVQSIYHNLSERFLMNLLFSVIVFCLANFVDKYNMKKDIYSNNTQKKIVKLTLYKLKFLINISSLMGIIGTFMLLYDRIFLKGIDYSQGIRHARYQWEKAVSPSIFSELLSKMANVLIPMAFISVLLLFLYWEYTENRWRLKKLLISLFSVFAYAFMNGSRSIIFIQVVMLLCIGTIRKCKKQKIFPKSKINKGSDKKFYFVFLVAILYAIYVFNSSAQMGETSARILFERLTIHLGGEFKEPYYTLLTENLSDNNMIYHIFSAMEYLIHSQWTSEAIFSVSSTPGNIFFFAPMHFLYNLGVLQNAPSSYLYEGLFISLPGSILYDFGFLSLIMFSIIYGFLIGLTIIKIRKLRNRGGFDFAFIMFILSSIYLTPFIPAHNFIYFNFIIVDMMLLEIISRVFIKKSTWIYLDI